MELQLHNLVPPGKGQLGKKSFIAIYARNKSLILSDIEMYLNTYTQICFASIYRLSRPTDQQCGCEGTVSDKAKTALQERVGNVSAKQNVFMVAVYTSQRRLRGMLGCAATDCMPQSLKGSRTK